MCNLFFNKWVLKTYENKALWASAYLWDNFFGRIRTTSQCESINSFIKSYVKKKSSIIEFLHRFNHALKVYRNNELEANFKTFYSQPVLTTYLRNIEKQASEIYTHAIFREVKQEIEKANAFIVCERLENGEKLVFNLKKYCKPGKEIQVVFDTAQTRFCCDCRLFECRGIPCCHIISIMRNEDVDYIPSTLICKRWSKSAKFDFISFYKADEMESDVMEQACYAVVAAACDNFTKVASRKRNYLNPILDDIRKLTIKYEKLVDGGDTNANPSVLGISDPTVVKTKGAPRKKKHSKKRTRHCSNCSSSVHTIRRCPTVNRKDGKSPKNDELTHSESSDNSAASECEKDDMASVETNGNETNPQFECRMKNKGKEKENFVAKKKGKRSNKR